MVRYSKIEDVPAWARSTIKEMMDAGLISGTGGGNLDLSADMLRMLYVMWRMRDTRYGRIVDGKVTFKAVADVWNLPYEPIEL